MSRRTIGIIDYGAGNLASVQRAFHSLGHRCRVTSDPEVLDGSELLVLPGVGAFPKAMESLVRNGLDEYVRLSVKARRPLLGICLGMQLLVEQSSEHRMTAGLGLIPGTAGPLPAADWHIGWNRLEADAADPVIRDSDGDAFYFNHSFAVEVPDEYRLASTRHGSLLTAAIRREHVIGLQFHPEKSQAAGRALLSAIVDGLCVGGAS